MKRIKIELLAKTSFELRLENYPPGWSPKQALEYEIARYKEDPEMFFIFNPDITVTGVIDD